MPKTTGLLETAIYVKDLDVSETFYRELFGFEKLLSDERVRALSIADKSVLLIFQEGASKTVNKVPGGKIPPHDAPGQTHLCFAIPTKELELWRTELEKQNIEMISEVRSPLGGTSLYFRDPDGHLVEIATPGIWKLY